MPNRDDNRWIVSSHRFVEHLSPTLAEMERNRLIKLLPHKRFRLYRIKRVLLPSDYLDEALVNELAAWTA